MKEQDNFDFSGTDFGSLLLILDRRQDLVAPLLLPWTYQSMVHELFGLRNGRVDTESFVEKDASAKVASLILGYDIHGICSFKEFRTL